MGPLLTPLLSPMVSADELARDSIFTEAARAMGSQLCDRQQTALNAVVDRAEFLERMALDVADTLEANRRSKPTSEEQENKLPIQQLTKYVVDENEQKEAPARRRHRCGGA